MKIVSLTTVTLLLLLQGCNSDSDQITTETPLPMPVIIVEPNEKTVQDEVLDKLRDKCREEIDQIEERLMALESMGYDFEEEYDYMRYKLEQTEERCN